MMTFFKNRLNRGAVRIVRGSFLTSTLLFLSYMAFPYDSLLGLAFTYVFIFIAVHVLLLATLALNALIHYKDYEENLMACIITSVNVAVAFLYLTLI